MDLALNVNPDNSVTPLGDAILHGSSVPFTANGHLSGAKGAAPTVVSGAQSTGAAITGSDASCSVTATSLASGNAAGAIATITFAKPFNQTPRVALGETNAATAAVNLYVSAKSATAVTVSCSTAFAASAAIAFDLIVVE